jgi:uncharacterized protein
MNATEATLRATPVGERSEVLDAVRGVLVLGVLIANVQFMSQPAILAEWQSLQRGGFSTPDAILTGLIGWLVSGKLISGLAIVFGAGMGVIAARSQSQGRLRRWLFVRRSAFLIVLGLMHMLLLFPGDILFTYGITGLIAIAFLRRSPNALLWWAGGILAVGVAINSLIAVALSGQSEGLPPELVEQGRLGAVAYAAADYGAVVQYNAITSAIAQSSGIVTGLLWILPLFLLGMAKARIITEPGSHRPLLRRIAVVCLPLGLIANLPLFEMGALGAAGATPAPGGAAVAVAMTVVHLVAVPILGIGYLAAAGWWWSGRQPARPVVAVGRMALTAYLLESLIVFMVFFGLGIYGQVGVLGCIGITIGTWLVIMLACDRWLRHFAYGPFEWLWRAVTYLRTPAMRPPR